MRPTGHHSKQIRSSCWRDVFYEMGDLVGSTSTVIDRDTGELVERVTNQAYGATDSDYRPDRWANFREPQRPEAGNDDDVRVRARLPEPVTTGPNLQTWMSVDPLTIHALASSFNPYS